MNNRGQIWLGFPMDLILLYVIGFVIGVLNLSGESMILSVIFYIIGLLIFALFVINFGLWGILYYLLTNFALAVIGIILLLLFVSRETSTGLATVATGGAL